MSATLAPTSAPSAEAIPDLNRLRSASAWWRISQILLVGVVMVGAIHLLDHRIYQAVMDAGWAETLKRGWLATFLRAPGNAPLVGATILGLLFFSRHHWRPALTMLAAVSMAGLVAVIFKGTFGRSRPGTWVGTPEWVFFRGGWGCYTAQTNVSFVSGDAALAFAWADCLGLLVPALRWPAYAWAGLTVAQRVLVGAHWPSDAVGGAVVGMVTVRLVVRILLRFAGPTQDVPAAVTETPDAPPDGPNGRGVA